MMLFPKILFNRGLLKGAMKSGSIGLAENIHLVPDDLGASIVGENNGWGIPIFKPQSQERLIELFRGPRRWM